MESIQQAIENIKMEKKPFWEDRNVTYNIQTYLDYYGFAYSNVEHRYGFIDCHGESIFVQSFSPTKTKAIIFVVHGYLDHMGSLKNLINFLTKKNYHVVSYDLQGHGLSSGKRAEITNFNQYVNVYTEITKQVVDKSLPVYAIGHSTGAAITIDCMLSRKMYFDKTILVAPLIRSYAWGMSKIGIRLLPTFVRNLQRVFKENSSHKDYLAFVKNDPLQHNRIPIRWIEALFSWYSSLEKAATSKVKRPILVVQGNKDKTVDWKYNLPFIQEKFTNSIIQMVDGGNHQLLNEDKALLNKTLHCIEGYLEKEV